MIKVCYIRIVLALSWCLLAAESSAQDLVGFADFPTTTGSSPVIVTTGDFNDDGITDLATANRGVDNISVLLGNDDGFGFGDGTFASPAQYEAAMGTRCVRTGDFNGDAITDLVVSNPQSDNISILLGNDDGFGSGDGTFVAAVDYPTSTSPRSVTTGDFNGDMITDIVTSNAGGDNISILLGNDDGFGSGDGTFVAAVDYATSEGPRALITGDFDSDNITDIATSNNDSNNVSVLIGNGIAGMGDGTFASPVNYDIGDAPYGMALGDFNEDGIDDLAIANVGSDSVSVLLGNGSGGAGDGTFATAVNYDAGDEPRDIALGDFNNDGITDLATANEVSDNISVFLGNGTSGVGDGTFASQLNYATGDFAAGITTGDLNGDGLTDIAVANREDDTVSILLNLGVDDVTSPTSSVISPSGTITQPGPTFDVNYTANDNVGGSGVANVELFYQRDGGGYNSFGNFSSSPISFDTSGTGGNGTYDFYTIATDVAGNTETKSPAAETSLIFNNNTNVEDWSVLND